MIPKIIHYCWFGGKLLPPLAQECIESWRRFLPDYEIKEWNERNFDVNVIPYTAEAYRQKKYAYVSDYARFEILQKYGGIYFDVDVEVIKPLNDIIARGCFMGFEQDPDGVNTPGIYAPRYCFGVALGLGFGMTKGHPFLAEMMDHYRTMEFETVPTGDISWYKTIVAHTTEKLCSRGLKNVLRIQKIVFEGAEPVYVYPSEYFAPINAVSRWLHVTDNTRTIHRYLASWSEQKNKTWKDYVMHYLPEFIFFWNNRRKRKHYMVSNS